MKIIIETLDSSRLIQSIREQILLLEPLLNVNKAYAMILRVEKQREVNLTYTKLGIEVDFMVKAEDGITLTQAEVGDETVTRMVNFATIAIHQDTCGIHVFS